MKFLPIGNPSIRAKTLTVPVPAATMGVLFTATTKLKAPVAFGNKAGNANLSIHASTGAVSAAAGITAGQEQTITFDVTGDDDCVQPWSLTLAAEAMAPLQVGTVTLTPGDGQLAAAWSAPSDGGSAITDYEIERRQPAGSGSYTTFSDGVSAATGATITGLANGTAAGIRVRAVNAVGPGPWSDEYSETPEVGGVSIPAQANLVAHWDAQAIPAQADNTTLTDWTDSINGLTVTQATSANRPWYRTNSIGNGKPSIEFRADQSMTVTSTGTALKTVIDSRVYTVMVIMTNGSVTVSTGSPFSTAPTNAGLILLNQGTLVGTYNGYLRATTVHNQFYTFGISSHASRGSRLYIDGGIIGQDSNQAQPTNSTTFSIGKIQGQGANTGLRGFIAEILIWDRQLTPVEALQLDDYARETYGKTNPRASGDFWIYDGDSITAGIGATVVRDNYPRYASQGKSLIYGQWTNVAIGGFTWPSMINKAAEIDDIVTYLPNPVKLAVWEFYNSRAIPSLISTYVIPYLQERHAIIQALVPKRQITMPIGIRQPIAPD
jgi:hypothetical protein